MNSFWNKNIESFCARFPLLAQKYDFKSLEKQDFDFWKVIPSKSGDLTATENDIFLHSKYNPKKEAENLVNSTETKNVWCAAFFSIGLGYLVLEWAKRHKESSIIIVESNPLYFFAALKYVDFTELFEHKSLILILQGGIEEVCSIIEKNAGFNHTFFFENKNQTNHAKEYFDALKNLIQRNKHKVELNNATLEKFSFLWLKNTCRNLRNFVEKEGISIYRQKCSENLPFLILSAGPTLAKVLPHLKELKKRTILIAVDTALKVCLQQNVEPDFIVLTDPQYYAWRHIAGLKSASSVLITESACYPEVFNFECRKIVLFSSLFPLGQFIESKTGEKGKLGTGGSVATTAWDFARFCGAKKIYCAGLDLSFPKGETHVKGSQFEEQANFTSKRISTTENKIMASVFNAKKIKDRNYKGVEVYTDEKMKMFAWWFESKIQEFPDTKTFSLSEESLFIPGISVIKIEEILNEKEKSREKNEFFNFEKIIEENTENEKKYFQILNELNSGFEQLNFICDEGILFCKKAVEISKNMEEMNSKKNSDELKRISSKLREIDFQILNSKFKEIASLVFPTENQLEKKFSLLNISDKEIISSFVKSKFIYEEINNSIKLYKKYLPKN